MLKTQPSAVHGVRSRFSEPKWTAHFDAALWEATSTIRATARTRRARRSLWPDVSRALHHQGYREINHKQARARWRMLRRRNRRKGLPDDAPPRPPPSEAIAGDRCCCGTRSAARRDGCSSPSDPLRTFGQGKGSAASAGAPSRRKRKVRRLRSHLALAARTRSQAPPPPPTVPKRRRRMPSVRTWGDPTLARSTLCSSAHQPGSRDSPRTAFRSFSTWNGIRISSL